MKPWRRRKGYTPKKEETVSEAEPGEPEELHPGKQVPRWKNRNGSEKEQMRRKWVESHAEQQGLDAELCKLFGTEQDQETLEQAARSPNHAPSC